MMVKPSVSLTFNGHCEEAFRLYERCLRGEITFLLKWGDSPMAKDAQPEWSGKVLHASLTIGDTVFSGGDVLLYEPPRGFAITLGLSDPAEAERLFDALAENGTVTVPLQETFWALRFGSVIDRFGIPWSINCEKAQ